ncbi:MAG: hypothetical protein KF773_41005 [Deltaproteobacteria bacterium]|nr:hypothetical protein [Deltaproteobacteria bacterium]
MRTASLSLLSLLALPSVAAAEGERSPMFGGSLTYMSAADRDAELVGAQLELASWHGRLGIAAEGSAWQGISEGGPRAVTAGGSLRLQLLDWLVPSLLEPRGVELAVELHGVVERVWWSADDTADRYGFGIAVRMRGGGDENDSPLLAESRVYVRVMRTRDEPPRNLAHAAAMPVDPTAGRGGVAVILGLGAAFGAGKPRYIERFRLRHSFDWGRPELSPRTVR